MSGGGDCFEAAGKFMMDEGIVGRKKSLRLVHAEVTGQGAIQGVRFGHAWVEDGDTVIDKSNGRDVRMPKSIYYALGHVYDDRGDSNMHVYTPQEFRKMVMRYSHWGPWDLETSSGL